ncbi:hypothetical protein TRFO_29459 [Tritrichomonas foetus]|uniref:Alcohol acetyltransferase n=1 Tax=Tritrichomonas foetus TaxID=1144522 RepID=A0A1J4JXN4_9EUKA|nr:hypothetical protein TRFO_29459 [Tritrichomonas foetus]|eukprot:OHT03216.1 hypothetical protein TRFO_29459 [Tritrichomonas foetus]
MLRSVNWQEKGLIDAGCIVHFALKFDSPNNADEHISQLFDLIPQFHYTTDNDKKFIQYNPAKPLISDFLFDVRNYTPNNLNEACKYSFDFCKPRNNSLASMTKFKNNVLVVNLSHAVADGGFLIDTIEKLQASIFNQNIKLNSNKIFNEIINLNKGNVLPLTPLDTLKNELEKSPKCEIESDFDPIITTYKSTEGKIPNGSNALRHIPFEIRNCHNSSKFSEKCWLSLPLSIHAFQNVFPSSVGCGTLVNLRPFIRPEFFQQNKHLILNHFSWVNVGFSEMNRKMIVNDVLNFFRESFKHNIEKKAHLSNIKSMFLPTKEDLERPWIERKETTTSTSNVGLIKIKKPIIDAFIIQNAERFARNCISLINYKVQHENGIIDTKGSITYGDQIISDHEAAIIASGVKAFFEKCNSSMTIQDTMNVIYQSQK